MSTETSSLPRKLFAYVAFLFIINLFFFHQIGEFGAGLFISLPFVLMLGIFEWKHHLREMLLVKVLLLASLTVMLFRANLQVQQIFAFLILLTHAVTLYVLTTNRADGWSLSELVTIPLIATKKYVLGGFTAVVGTIMFFASTGFNTLFTFFGGKSKEKQKPQVLQHRSFALLRSTFIGLIVGLPIMFILLSMLAKADPIFSHVIQDLFKKSLFEHLPMRILLTGIFGVITFPLLFIKNSTEPGLQPLLHMIYKRSWVKEFTIVMVLVALTLGAYLVIERPYIFASVPAETDLHKYGVNTYSEYVREGFTWFLRAAVFIFTIIWAGLLMLRGKAFAYEKRLLNAAQLVVLGEFFVFLVSVFRRIWLYQQYHGMSLIRAYGAFFLTAVALLTITLFLRHVSKKPWIYLELVGLGALLCVFGSFNVERYIAESHPPTVNARVDYVYLSRMSADGYVGWLKAYTHAEEVLNKQDIIYTPDGPREIAYAGMALRQLFDRYDTLVMTYGTVEEKKAYLHALIQYELAQTKEQEHVYSATVDELKKNPSQQARLDQEHMQSGVFRLQQSQKDLEEIEADLNTEPVTFRSQVEFVGFQSYVDFHNVSCQQFNECPVSFFSFWGRGRVKPTALKQSMRSAVFQYSFAKKRAFEAVSRDMPIEKLLQLQDAFFGLYKRLAKENGERLSYDQDISLDSPYLESVRTSYRDL